MVTAIRVHHTGGPEVLRVENLELPPPSAGEVRIRHTAIGVNFIDTYFRSGLYKTALPFSPGNEAAGVIEAVGDGVDDLKCGQRVVYLYGPVAYAEAANVPAAKVVPLPDSVSDEVGAASLLKGLTAQYLLRQTFAVGPQTTLLFHAAAGGVGLIAGQWARALGATVIGTAGSPEKIELALSHGYDRVINYRETDFASRFLELTGGKRADVVYDSVGRDTFDGSLNVLRPRGLLVSFGQSSGPVAPFDLGILNAKGSLYVTRPSLFAYFPDALSLRTAAAEVHDQIARGVITIRVDQRFALTDAHKAHEALESRTTTGTTILIP